MKKGDKVRIIVEIGVEIKRHGDPDERDVYSGDFRVSPMLATRLTKSMANHLAMTIKRDLMRRHFRPLKGYVLGR